MELSGVDAFRLSCSPQKRSKTGEDGTRKRQMLSFTPLDFEDLDGNYPREGSSVSSSSTYFMEEAEMLAWEATQLGLTQESPVPATQLTASSAVEKPPPKVSAFEVMMQSEKLQARAQRSKNNAFNVLMAKKPRAVKNRGQRGKAGGQAFTPLPPSRCPFYKRIPGSPFIVDGFRFASKELSSYYVLTHFHSYGGFGANSAPCKHWLDVTCSVIYQVPYNEPLVVEGTEMTFLDANHCPGAAMVLFRTKFNRTYLHVGDFRWCDDMKDMKCLQPFAASLMSPKRLDALYLDTTYCSPNYRFPKQKDVIAGVVELVKEHLSIHPGTAFLFGTYSIGKERVFMAVAKALGERLCVSKSKFKILSCLDWCLSDMALLTTNPREARLHVVSMGHLNLKGLRGRLADAKAQNIMTPSMASTSTGSLDAMWARAEGINPSAASVTPVSYLPEQPVPVERIVAFKPTGWTFSGEKEDSEGENVANGIAEHRNRMAGAPRVTTNSGVVFTKQIAGVVAGKKANKALTGPGKADAVTIYGVPYSEHSSFDELRECVAYFDPLRIIPTVNCRSKADSDRLIALLKSP